MDLNKIAKKWQKRWEEKKIFNIKKNSRKKFYVLEMFPYPSGLGLHMGHAFNYTVGDIYARFKRMSGFNVLYPMGYDSFGLPAENAAIKAKSHPKKFTDDAIKNYIKQQKAIGLSYDWSRMIQVHKPEYYKWDQWIFLEMFKRGLAYKKKSPVNWCPKCDTVLANEQVNNGRCWRHEETEVQIKNLEQWFLKITNYADELYENIDKLKEWPELIKKLQKNWIGKSHGTEIIFSINNEDWKVFTTRPDTLFGVTFLVISAQHPRLKEITTKEQQSKVESFIKNIHSTSEEDMLTKEGVFTGSYATHPLTHERIPIYAGNFVLADYGSGMVMAVPAHDQRDFEFAKKYNIPIKQVIQSKEKITNQAYTGEGILINSDKFNGLNSAKAKEKITDYLKSKKLGKSTITFRLRDWLISRQRFWGTPIPIINCKNCGPVPNNDIPIILPDNIKFTGTKNPLLNNKKFLEVKCPKCKGKAERETDTMDTFVNSSWYFLRYTDPKNKNNIFKKENANYWCPVDVYIGGKEHACMHLIYFRFYTKFLRDIGLLKFDEPAVKLFNHGMLHGEGGEKMSKSTGKVVLPEEVSKEYGIDSARFFLLSLASPDKDRDWNKNGIDGSHKFLRKFYDCITTVKIGKSSKRTQHKINIAIQKITESIESFRYDHATIAIRNVISELEENISKDDLNSLIKLISPFCPHLAEELWEKTGNKGFISLESWPKLDKSKIDIKIEEEDNLISKVKSDIEEIKNLIKIKPTKAALIVSNKWKYDFFKDIKKANSMDIKEITKAIKDKSHMQEGMKIIHSYTKRNININISFTQKEEIDILKKNKKSLEDETGLKITVETSETSKHQKAQNAIPGKPAIVLE
ncbi:MAG: leucine--tRNA ligase [Nanoarchaeota archaeon]|nr:leucine--tRNA ligase [Nanoarchaeota archaeon]